MAYPRRGTTPVSDSWYLRTNGLCWPKVQVISIFYVAVAGLFLAFLLKSSFAKLVLWHSIYLIASHLLAQFIYTEFANKIKFLLLATLQSLYSCEKMGCTQFLLTLHQPKCVLTPILYCQRWGHSVAGYRLPYRCAAQYIGRFICSAEGQSKHRHDQRKTCTDCKYFTVSILDYLYHRILWRPNPQTKISYI